ncbi:MAG: hypothetical protein RLZ33_746 [Bacteroidota bacterium]|jgi:hypothetical protein
MLLRKNALLVFTVCTSGLLFAQSNTLPTGGDASGSGGNVSFSIGQIDYTSNSGSNGNLNQGVQQPYEFYSVIGINELEGTFSLIMGPNPTTNEVQLTVMNYANNDLVYALSDMNGKTIISRTPFSGTALLNLENCAPGMYQLFISNNENQVKTYKILKH